MQQHRVRLDDDDLTLIIAALTARRSGVGSATRAHIDHLVARLGECSPGNPVWRLAGLPELEATAGRGRGA